MGLRNPKKLAHQGRSLAEILAAHERFFRGQDGGARADLEGADLSRAELQGVNLSGAILRRANLEGADLRGAKLPGGDFSRAQLCPADTRITENNDSSRD